MNRRSALLLTTLLGGLLPTTLLAQAPVRRGANRGPDVEPDAGGTSKPLRNRRSADDLEATGPAPKPGGRNAEPEPDADGQADAPADPALQRRVFDISGYTALDHSQPNPQNAVVEWILRRTGTAPWHGEKPAVLSASRARILAYNDPKYVKWTGEVVDRFTNAVSDFLKVRVKFVAAVDTRWRYAVYSRLTPVGNGPQGQEIWTLKSEDAQFVLAQMQTYQGFRLITNQEVEMVNGQTLTVKTSENRGYTGGMQRENATGLGYQPKADQIEEGVTLRLSPLLTFEGDSLDAAIDLTANTVKSLHRTKVLAPREVGPSEISIDVPEVVESRLNQTVKGWPLGQTLLISAGIQPGILQDKGGFMNLRIPGTTPTGTELLIFLDADSAAKPRRTAAKARGGSRRDDTDRE